MVVSKRLLAAIIILLFMMMSIFTSLQNVAAQVVISERYNVTETIRGPSDIPSGCTLMDINFTIDYEFSFAKTYAQQTIVNIPTGVVGHTTLGNPMNITLEDNLGNTFEPIIHDNTITNLERNGILIPANFEYKLTLKFSSVGDCYFLKELGAFGFGYGANQTGRNIPINVTFKIPNGYQVILASDNAEKSNDGSFESYNWQTQSETFYFCLTFLPFSTVATVRSLEVRVEALTSSPTNGGLKETLKMTYDAVGTVLIWNYSLRIPVNIPFPSSMSGCEVLSVFDGQGKCQPRTEPIDVEKIDPSGKYYVDTLRHVVTIYPRDTYQDTTQRFDLEITFKSPNDPSVGYLENSALSLLDTLNPYKGVMSLKFDFFNTTYLQLGLTGNLKVEFVLPQGMDSPSSADNDSFIQSMEDNNLVITFNYDSPICLPKQEWTIFFEKTELRNYFMNQCFNIFLLLLAAAIITIVMKFVKFQKKIEAIEGFVESVLLVALFGSVGNSIYSFISLSSYRLLIWVCFVLEIAFSLIVIILIWKFYTQRKAIDYQIV